ncbi:Na(+)/H(+) antiporter NhaA [compost metagenome]
MSLFIAGQAFPVTADFVAAKIAVFAASIVSALIGVALLSSVAKPAGTGEA